MKIHSVGICNYKSIGDSDNKIILDPAVTAIIGKNESGKSNIINGLRQIKFTNDLKSTFVKNNVNRNNDRKAKISFKIILQPSDGVESIDEDTIVTIDENNYSAKGGVVTLFNKELGEDFNTFIELLKKNPIKLSPQERTIYDGNLAALTVNDELNIPKICSVISNFSNWLSKVNAEYKEIYKEVISNINNKWQHLVSRFPVIFYRDDNRTLATEYSGESLKKELNNKDSILIKFFKYLDFSRVDIEEALSSGTGGSVANLRGDIEKAVNEKINIPFNKFYTAEKITLKVNFQPNVIYFTVVSDNGPIMTLGERSDGLRWYLNLFIDMLINNITNEGVLYLFDEPGIHLHVNAQKELLKLFDDLVSKGNQVVYTTHSPYMLNVDTEGIERIRAVEKDKTGNTIIHNKPYSADFVKSSRKDTLTPIIYALGMNLADTFGPALNKINVVTEGVSDSIYLKAIGTLLKLDFDKYAIVSAVGASNIKDICAILNGWGCPFVALYDYDKEGVEAGKVLSKKYELKRDKHFIYVKDVTDDDLNNATYDKTEKTVIEDLVTNLSKFKVDECITNEGKIYIATHYAESIKNGTYECPQETLYNFKELFDRIDACAKLQEV